MKISTTWRDCTIIRIGAYSAERITSSSTLAATPITPPAPRRTRVDSSARMKPRAFGTSSTIMLNQNSAIISSTSKRGQVGNSWKSWLKYSGRIRCDCTVSAKPMASITSQSGEDR